MSIVLRRATLDLLLFSMINYFEMYVNEYWGS
jgi:hypothetical protein